MNKARLAAALVTTLLIGRDRLQAEQCSRDASNLQALIEEASRTCSPKLLYAVAATWEGKAAPGLRVVYEQGRLCSEIQRAARAALAKLGDPLAFDMIQTELKAEELNANAIGDLRLIGDDRAIAVLMTYMVDRDSDRSRIVNFGDHHYDPMFEIVAAMQDIASRRLLKGTTSAKAGVGWDWNEWWKKYKGSSVSVPVYQSVADPYLRCLARKVDWGFPNAILKMANERGKAAEETVRSFPQFSSRQALGTIDGNLEAALAKLGDRAAFEGIAAHLQERQSSFRIAVPKLEFIGSKEAIDALIEVLGMPTKGLMEAKTVLSTSTSDKYGRFLAEDRHRVELQINREFQISILQALAHMVEKPPLGADAPPTPESFQKWRDWWAKNRDVAELVRSPPGKYE